MSQPNPKHLHQTAELRCFRSNVDGVRELPERILVVPWGRNETPNGPLIVDDVTARLLPVNQAAANYQVIAGDYEHGTALPGAKEPQEIACRGRLSVVEPGNAGGVKPGLYFYVTEWTESGRRHVGGGHYPGVSIACLQDDAGRVIFGHSVGFVRNPAVPGVSVFSAALALPSTQPTKSNPMDKLRMALIEALRSAGHDVADDIDEAGLVAALSKAGLAPAAAPAPSGEVNTFSAQLTRMEALITGLNQRIVQSEASAADREREAAVAQITGVMGKAIPLSPDMLKRFSAAELLKEAVNWPEADVPRDASLPDAGEIKTYGANPASRAARADKDSVAAQLGLDAKEL